MQPELVVSFMLSIGLATFERESSIDFIQMFTTMQSAHDPALIVRMDFLE